ncbi:MarR family transcriptional regulator [Aggregicoccus sp. 17bor-14]|uniref:MarR family winged helix-turn-helix transcriptional regulator n=1 Tax=Myxococcaceae TaxID=31 RepID=UPI00129CC039|nr:MULTISPECIES: MarR family transcriptional regulator [Myxococcaceae]MBF5045322.1 MarR family transcriptional regulator [Simulacricoccus sp. 17bor-14]MRI91064.1 MarR family transcriptional regulator [Aggregicoccus sp. 17bor-14]
MMKDDTAPRPSADAQQLHELLVDLGRHRSLRDPIGTLCEDLQLTHPQAHTILWLGEEGALTMGVLARRAGITEKTITGVIDRLETMGLVERLRSAEDRRAVSAHLTAKGQELYAQMRSHMNDGLDQLLSFLEPDDRCALFGLLQRLVQRLKARASVACAAGATPGSKTATDP